MAETTPVKVTFEQEPIHYVTSEGLWNEHRIRAEALAISSRMQFGGPVAAVLARAERFARYIATGEIEGES